MGTARVLVVDDEPEVLSLLKTALESSGLDVVTADSGHLALNILAKQPGQIAVVLTDVRMPAMSGPQLVRRVLEYSPAPEVVFMSGDTGQEIVDSRIPMIGKPIQLSVLIATIEDLLARRKTLASEERTHINKRARLVAEIHSIAEDSAELARASAGKHSSAGKH
jgi:DNA-binding NtrC family response regulator